MTDKNEPDTNVSDESRRTFLKTLSASAVAGGLGISPTEAQDGNDGKTNQDCHKPDHAFVPGENPDLHICRGLNMKTSANGKGPGECDQTNIPPKDLHGCMGGNTCKGLGGCGTGDYATQYWVSENECGRAGTAWTGSGGCGVPLGSTNTGFILTQLNNAVPADPNSPKDFVGVPVWAIARARFEARMMAAKPKPVPFGPGARSGRVRLDW